MPPPAKKLPANVSRPPISTSSLLQVPEDAVEGYQDRIESSIAWTLLEQAARVHKAHCMRNDIPTLSFKDALNKKLKRSFCQAFLDESSSIALKDLYEVSLSTTLWDNENFANEEGHICFKNQNCITDGLDEVIKAAVKADSRDMIKKELRKAYTLRVTDSEMTQLDPSLSKYRRLETLNLCGNFISDIDVQFLPRTLQILELQANRISKIDHFASKLPPSLVYLGLCRNLLTNECSAGLSQLLYITVLDLADNDIYDLEPVLKALSELPKLCSLLLAGNPCSVCAVYAAMTISYLPNLAWLDNREIRPKDRAEDSELFDPHPDDLRSAYLVFTVFRVISAPMPPKIEKGMTATFHIEVELPLLDSERRKFLMYRRCESLTEIKPPDENEVGLSKDTSTLERMKTDIEVDVSAAESDIFNKLICKNSREIIHYTLFESNKVQWNKIMTFQEPTVRIFCPDLRALRDTFRSEITVRLVYYLANPVKASKSDKKSLHSIKPLGDQFIVMATIKCKLQRLDWTQSSQHFHWDETMESDYAIHWGDGDLSIMQYMQTAPKATKGKPDVPEVNTRKQPPDDLTCHFGFGIETTRPGS